MKPHPPNKSIIEQDAPKYTWHHAKMHLPSPTILAIGGCGQVSSALFLGEGRDKVH
jgi:hypothetical protein